MKQKIQVDFEAGYEDDPSYCDPFVHSLNSYHTDYAAVESAIYYWSEGQTMNPDGERIKSHYRLMAQRWGEDLWLTTNDIPIGLNSAGTLILIQYDLDYLTEHHIGLTAAEMHEIITHVDMAIAKCAEAAVWMPEVWHTFPRAERLDRIVVPF